MARIETLSQLEALYDAPVPLSLTKVAPALTALYRKWIEGSRFCVLSTVGPGGVRGTPRGDDGPVVRVQDAQTLLMPDWRGNNRIEALRDIVQDGRVALLFLVPGSGTTVRVNGHALLTDDPALCQSFEQRGRHPVTVIVITVHEVYTQCAKALLRSGLWSRDDADTVPTVGQLLADMSQGAVDARDYDTHYVARSQPKMW